MYNAKLLEEKVVDGKYIVTVGFLPEDSDMGSEAEVSIISNYTVVETKSQIFYCKLIKSIEYLNFKQYPWRLLELEVYAEYRKELIFKYKKQCNNPYEAVRLNQVISKITN